MKYIIGLIFRLFGKIIPDNFSRLINYLKIQYNTGCFENGLASCGSNTYVMPPMICNGKRYIHVGDDFKCFSRGRIEAFDRYKEDEFTPEVYIGNNVNINFDFHLGCINQIVIGDNVLIGSRVIITDHNHGTGNEKDTPPVNRPLYSKGKIYIGNNVWIGDAVVILSGVSIGDNSIIGANAVVVSNIPRNSIAVGNPAKVVREIKYE